MKLNYILYSQVSSKPYTIWFSYIQIDDYKVFRFILMMLFMVYVLILLQSKLLEAWGNMERQHVSAVSNTDECLHAVVCKVPLADGAKVGCLIKTSIADHELLFN